MDYELQNVLRSPLYGIIDAGVCARRALDPIELTRSMAEAGARLFQVRSKGASDSEFLGLIDGAVEVAGAFGAQVIVNDRTDLALMAGAAGVHLGQDDLSVAQVRAIAGPDLIVGLSTHDPLQVEAALETDASYIAVGPIFETSTKDTGYSARGLTLVQYAAGRGKPVVAIGGITLETAPELRRAGAAALAVISDLLVGSPGGRVREYLEALR